MNGLQAVCSFGTITTDLLTNLTEKNRFYQELYRSKTEVVDNDSSINEFLNKLGISKLHEEQKQSGERKKLHKRMY